MSYFRQHFRTFQEFQREAFLSDGERLGREELELLEELEAEDDYDKPRSRQRRRVWD